MKMKMKKVEEVKKRMWKPEEDMILKTYVEIHGEGNWSSVSKKLGLRRGGKSCRLRWKNYLRPDIKHGSMSSDEEDLIIRMHKLIGNRWALIAGRLPGRTDNEVKNYWNTYLSKKVAKHRPRRKSVDKNDTKQPEIGNNEEGGVHQGEVKETNNNTNMVNVDLRDEEEEESINNNKEFDEKYWSRSVTGEVGVGPGSDNAGSLMDMDMDMDLMMEGANQFMLFGGELEGHGRCDLFDTFGFINWEDTHPPLPNSHS